MARPSQPLVLRGPAWLGSPWGVALGVSLVLATLAGVYAIGRAQATFDGRAAIADEAGLRAALTAREAEVAKLRREVAELDTLKVAQERERQEVSRTIGELQAEVARQSQQLEFLRGVVGRAGPAAEVTIRQVRVIASAAPGRYRLRIALAQPGRPDRTVAGSVRVGVEGQRGGRTVRLDLREVTAQRVAQLPYRFQYFENIEVELVLPNGFSPERVVVDVRPAGRNVPPAAQTVLWSIDPA
ncbi:MAG: hypothetical protein LW605_05195 [Xanthomonadales bacterium]|nr:hypothetical protein [Xanthomonadales bacterium]